MPSSVVGSGIVIPSRLARFGRWPASVLHPGPFLPLLPDAGQGVPGVERCHLPLAGLLSADGDFLAQFFELCPVKFVPFPEQTQSVADDLAGGLVQATL